MSSNLRNIIRIVFLVLFDLSAFYFSLTSAYYTRQLMDLFAPGLTSMALTFSYSYLLQLWWLPAIFMSFIAYERLYVKKLPFWDETREFLKAISASTIAVLAIITLGKMYIISRLAVLYLWCFGLFAFPLFRLAGKRMLDAAGLWKDNVIIIGAGSAGIDTAKGLQSDSHLGLNVIGFLDDGEPAGTVLTLDDGTTFKVFGKIRHFRKFVRGLDISTVIIAMPSLSVDKLSELTNEIQKYTKSVLLVPDIKGVALTNTELYHLFVQQLFLLKISNNLKAPFNRFVKKTFDLTVSVLFLPLLLPLIGLLGLLIKLDSPGPVFYGHTRIGRRGRPFCVYKFRSMHRDAGERLDNILKTDPAAKQEWDSYFKLKNDPRITRMGNFLRRTSLDELPQIFNVLRGEMSLVGPRPVLRDEITQYYKECADFYHLVRPGITGLWQVSGRNDVDYDVRVRLDAWYVLNWSVWLDIVILFKTVRVVLNKEGAY